MFNPHIHQQQQQQQLHQHLRQLQHFLQQQPPPPPQPPPAHHVAHHHQTQRAIQVPPQTAPPPRMVNLCQATQTTIIAPNPMLQGALMMQQMQGSMRGFAMGGTQFRQFFTAGARSSLLGPVPMGMAIKSPMMGFPAARPFHPHSRFYNSTSSASATPSTATASTSSSISTTDAAAPLQTDRKRDSGQMAAGSTDNQPAADLRTNEETDKTLTDDAVGGGVHGQPSEEHSEEPAAKRQKTEESQEPKDQCVVDDVTTTHSECDSNTVDTQPAEPLPGCSTEEDGSSNKPSDLVEGPEDTEADESYSGLPTRSPSCELTGTEQQEESPAEDASENKDALLDSPQSQEEEEEAASESSNKFYCYLCSITCHNQQNFRSHMNSISHQQRMMEIQHMSNACLVTLLPRVQESLQGANKDGEKKDPKHWCATCRTHFTGGIVEHHRSEEHKLACRIDISVCAVCKIRFKTSQDFLEHLHSQEHRQKLQERGCEALTKLSTLDMDGFLLEGKQEEGGDGGDTEDAWSSHSAVTLNDLASEEQYEPDTVYGSSFLDPVAGFICRLCNKFYLLESSALHTHCKSPKHLENFKRYRELMSQTSAAVQSSGKSDPPADGFKPVTETSTDSSGEALLSFDSSEAANLCTMEPVVAVSRLKTQKEKELEPETHSTSQDIGILATSCSDDGASLHCGITAQESPAEVVDPELAAAAAAEESNGEEEEEEAPAIKKNGTGRAKPTAKRRSTRATNRR
uniref:Cdkn1a interacting zinc finger protein 1a n=2 Tax=Nothobranchius kadleci TaxID=1051664 RepID=A0A1A8CI73_NOTKA